MATYTDGLPHVVRADPVRAIEGIKRLVVEQLGSLPGVVYAAVEQALRLSVALAPIDSDHNPYRDQAAIWILRQHHATHVMAFRQQLAHALDKARLPARDGTGGTPLELLSEGELEGRLAAQRAAEPLDTMNKIALEALDGRFAALARCVGRTEHGSNPVTPLALIQAFMSVFAEEQVPTTLREHLLKQYEAALMPLLPGLYSRTYELLAEFGFGDGQRRAAEVAVPRVADLPPTPPRFDADFEQVPIRAYRSEATPSPAAGTRQVGSTAATPPRDASGMGRARPDNGPVDQASEHSRRAFNPSFDRGTAQDIDELRNLLHAWRQHTTRMSPNTQADAPGGPGAHHPRMPFASPGHAAPVRDLTVHELMGVASLLQGEQVETFSRALAGRGRLAETIRSELRDGSRRLGLVPDRVRFTAVEDDSIDLVALLFDTLFARHRLPDRARRVYGRLVMPMVKAALLDLSMFVRETHPARRLLEAVTEACAGNAGETPQERELLDRAAAAAQRVAADYNEDSAVFDLARSELDGMLVQQRRRAQLQEERAAQAALGRERLQRAREQADAIVASCLAGSPVSRDVAEFLVSTWRHQLVQAFLREGDASVDCKRLGDALIAADQASAAVRSPELADRLIALEPAMLVCLASSGHDDSAARHGVATLVRALVDPDAERALHVVTVEATPEDIAEAHIWLLAEATRVPGETAERMAALVVGDWVQVTDRAGESMAAKLAWISPLTERRLLVNRRGARVFAATVGQLAQLAHESRLVRIDDHAAVGDAMREVCQRLHQGVSLH